MIIPDEDSKMDAADSFGSIPSVSLASRPVDVGQGSNAGVNHEEHDEALPQYTPRETDPLLGDARRRRKHWKLETYAAAIPWILFLIVLASIPTFLIVAQFIPAGRRTLSGELCRDAKSWTALGSNATDGVTYAWTNVALPLELNALAITSYCDECSTRLRVDTSQDHDAQNV